MTEADCSYIKHNTLVHLEAVATHNRCEGVVHVSRSRCFHGDTLRNKCGLLLLLQGDQIKTEGCAKLESN